MENREKDLESKNRKTLKEYCIKNHFFIEDKNKKILEYSDDKIKLFLDKIIKIKNEKKEKLVVSYKDILKKEKDTAKSINKNLYTDIFEIEIGTYPYEFLFVLLKELEKNVPEKFLTLKYFNILYERDYLEYVEKQEARFLIRNQKPLFLKEKKRENISYEKKIKKLRKKFLIS